ncbi:hypothetical protein AB1Y20_023746 [Prymnesium parvum]|uniref:ILEI/PANDER domain-containing protein n=1 Tax=Prymnesium parvum TaxID=97485 RepID=A0AB34JF73_PRYPA
MAGDRLPPPPAAPPRRRARASHRSSLRPPLLLVLLASPSVCAASPPLCSSCVAGGACGLCLRLVAPNECPPLASSTAWTCDPALVALNQLCEADGSCGTSEAADNCGEYDIYRRIDCCGYLVESKGSHGSSAALARFLINGEVVADRTSRGMNFVVVHPANFEVVEVKSFETHAPSDQAAALTQYVLDLTSTHLHHIVLVGVYDEASEQLTPAAYAALAYVLGATLSAEAPLCYRCGYGLIARVRAQLLAEDVAPQPAYFVNTRHPSETSTSAFLAATFAANALIATSTASPPRSPYPPLLPQQVLATRIATTFRLNSAVEIADFSLPTFANALEQLLEVDAREIVALAESAGSVIIDVVFQVVSTSRAAAIVATLTGDGCAPSATTAVCTSVKANLEQSLSISLLELPIVAITRVVVTAPSPSLPTLPPSPSSARPPPSPIPDPPLYVPLPPSPSGPPLPDGEPEPQSGGGNDIGWILAIVLVIILSVALAAALLKIRLLNKQSSAAVNRHPMMAVVHSPYGDDAPPPQERQLGAIELYEPPQQIGGGRERSDNGGGGWDSMSRQRMQRALDRAKAANAKKCRRGDPQTSQVPVVVHVPLPDLSQPIVTAMPEAPASGIDSERL